MSKVVKGQFSPTKAGSKVRRMFDENNNFLGVIAKTDEGYRVVRKDGKVRVKPKLQDAYKSIARAN